MGGLKPLGEACLQVPTAIFPSTFVEDGLFTCPVEQLCQSFIQYLPLFQ